MSSFLYKILVMGSREFEGPEQVEFLRKQMLGSFFSALKQDESAAVQFVFPSEVGRDGIERAVRGVARTGLKILESARRAGRSHAQLRDSELAVIDWSVVEYTYSKSSPLSLEEQRKVAPNIIWNREVLKDHDLSEVIVLEHDGADYWCRDMMRRATADGLVVRQLSSRSWTPGAARAGVAR